MKKLMMIAAAMTIASGAFAAACNPSDEESDCALVYKVKMQLTTTQAKSLSTKCDTVCYRKKGKVSLQGYAFGCDLCDCAGFQDDLVWVLWDKKIKGIFVDSIPAWEFLNVIGKKDNEVEGAFTIEDGPFVLLASGLGKMLKKGPCVPQKMSGNVAGFGYPQGCTSGTVCEPGEEVCSYAFDCADYCDDEEAVASGEYYTVFFGKWSISYNKSFSKKFAGDWDIEKKIPDYDYYYGCEGTTAP